MKEMVAVNAARMSSLEIAELVGSQHGNVRISIERLAKRGVIQLPAMQKVENKQSVSPNKFSDAYIFEGEQGKRDSIVVVAQLCPEFTARLVDRWMELEEQIKQLEAPQQQPQLIPGTPEHFAACYRAYFGEPVLPSLTAQQQHTEPVQALPPVGEHHACPANKISLNKMKDYVSNEKLLRKLIDGFGLEGELFDPGCVKGTNQAARPYVVYNKSQVMAMLKAAQCLSEKQDNGKRKLLGICFSIRNVIPATAYDSIDFDAACEMIILMKATTC